MTERRNSSDSSFEHRKKNKSKSVQKQLKGNIKTNNKRNSYRINDIKMQINKKESDIKNHIKFMNLKIHPRNQHLIIENLKQKLPQCIGPITHITRISNTQKYQDCLSLVVGFKYDMNALQFLEGKYNELEIRYHKDMIKFKPIPTQVFSLIIPKLKISERQKIDKNYIDRSHSRQKNKDNKAQMRRKYDRGSSERSRDKKNKRKISNSSSSSNSPNMAQFNTHHSNSLKTVFIFGIPTFTRDKKISQILRDMKQEQFFPQQMRWKKIQNTNCQYLQLIFENKKAEKLLSLKDRIRIDGFPVIIIEGNIYLQGIRKQLKLFQFLIKFPQKIAPSSLYRGISQCGKIVQLVAEQRLEDGLSESYVVSLSNRQLANEIRKLGITSQGVVINEVSEGQLIYRPSYHSSLHILQKKERLQKQSR